MKHELCECGQTNYCLAYLGVLRRHSKTNTYIGQTQMKFLFAINQSEAFTKGIDAFSSTARVDIEPESLTEEQRKYLVSEMRDGFDVSHVAGLKLLTPTLEEVRAKIDTQLAQKREEQAEADREALALLSERRERESFVRLSRSGEVVNVDRWVAAPVERSIRYTEIQTPDRFGMSPLSEDILKQVEAAQTQNEAALDAAIAAVLPEMRAELQAVLAREAAAEIQKAESEAKQKEAYDALYARLPASLRDRHAAGYAKDKEIRKALKRLIVADSGLQRSGPKSWDTSVEADSLSDVQFARLTQIKALRLPQGATVTARYVSDWAACEEHPDYGDADCDVCTSGDKATVARVQWTDASGLTVQINMSLDDDAPPAEETSPTAA